MHSLKEEKAAFPLFWAFALLFISYIILSYFLKKTNISKPGLVSEGKSMTYLYLSG